MNSNTPKHAALGGAIARARLRLGMGNQSALANALNVTQQTVSRWEAGTSRPPADQARRLAALLDAPELVEMAGYAPADEVVSFAKPFPIDRLDPTTFEQLAAHVIAVLYKHRHGPGVEVRRAGGTGHKQDGVDVTATLPTGLTHGFQVKRMDQFGPAEVAKAVSKDKSGCDRMHLVLSRIASPQAAAAAREAGWSLWDKDDLSRMIRTEMTGDEQDRLVDIFFNGRRRELLGRSEPGPWLTTEEFFAPFVGRGSLFNHDWALAGRVAELTEIENGLKPDASPVLIVTGPAGMGKTRLLKTAIEHVQDSDPLAVVRWLSTSTDWTPASIEALGRGRKILVVDDAHDRERLPGLMHFAAITSNNTQLVLASRLYAVSKLHREAAAVSIDQPTVVRLEPLRFEQAKELARLPLTQQRIDAAVVEEVAEQVARAAPGTPLVTLMLGTIVAREGIPPEAAKNRDAVKALVMRADHDTMFLGDLGPDVDRRAARRVLDILAAIQPFHVEDESVTDLIEAVTGIDAMDSVPIIRVLVDAGVLFQRAHLYRLMPDLLGDYLIAESCLDASDKLSPFAKKVLKHIGARHLHNTLVNLGRLDWRRRFEDRTKQPLLDEVWRGFSDLKEPYDERLGAIEAVAIFQPRQAIDFVTGRIRAGIMIDAFSRILRNAAYNLEYVTEACQILWEQGRNDPRQTGQHIGHALRVLTELVEFGERKPLSFSRRAFEFGFALLDDPKAWESKFSPLDIVQPVLSAEGMTTTSDGQTMTLRSFMVDPDVVAPLRQQLIAKVIELLSHSDVRTAYRAAAFTEHALRWPIGMMGAVVPADLRKAYDQEAARTLAAIRAKVEAGDVPAPAMLALARTISWHAQHGDDATKSQANAIFDAFPDGLAFRLLAALSDGYGNILEPERYSEGAIERQADRLAALAAELKQAYPPQDLVRTIDSSLVSLAAAGDEINSAHQLISHVCKRDIPYSRAFVAFARAKPDAHIVRSLGFALYELVDGVPAEGRAIVNELLDGFDERLAEGAARALGGPRRPREPADLALLAKAISSSLPSVATVAVLALWQWRDQEPQVAIDLLKRAQIGTIPQLAENVFMQFQDKDRDYLSHLTESDASCFLQRIAEVDRIDGHWTQEFLAGVSDRFPGLLIRFFMRRVEYAVEIESFSFHPVNHGPYSQVVLRVNKSPEAPELLAQVWDWMTNWKGSERACAYFRHHAIEMFDELLAGGDAERVAFLQPKLDTADRDELRWMGRLLRHGSARLSFDHHDFVVRFLERCHEVDLELVKDVTSDLYAASYSGVRSSIVGKPSPRDLDQKTQAEEVLSQLSPISPAYTLYLYLKESAEADIKRSRRDAEANDE